MRETGKGGKSSEPARSAPAAVSNDPASESPGSSVRPTAEVRVTEAPSVTATETVEVTETRTRTRGETTAPAPEDDASGVYYENCDAARDAGAAPVHAGEPGYGSHLDRDGDGVGCEPYAGP
ncbi:excalibur calcium-binding domain-containing protein [Streptomyces sp. enrichment culture]|uniref:excalibur calcium-binding domain-containing protein n=1 Tax=Streptomyces sp. enrichment culture TaxID=1795815 RepID=UPI003F56174F